MKDVTETLALGMADLSTKELRNLKFHLEKKSPIICGKDANLFAKPGCGCPATLAAARRLPKDTTRWGSGSVSDAWEKITNATGGNKFYNALRKAQPRHVRAAIEKALELRGI